MDLREYIAYQRDIGVEGFPTIPRSTGNADKDGGFSSGDLDLGISEDSSMTLEAIREQLLGCKRCKLDAGRKNIVFGTGNENAELMFVGEGPGRDEDIKGEPFVGKAGQLLTRIINAIDLNRRDVY
ncbi:MAG: uracil-DNA glycosylase, partial [Pseudomonadota bacterium]